MEDFGGKYDCFESGIQLRHKSIFENAFITMMGSIKGVPTPDYIQAEIEIFCIIAQHQ